MLLKTARPSSTAFAAVMLVAEEVRNPLIWGGVVVEIALVALIGYTPLGNSIFGTAPIDTGQWTGGAIWSLFKRPRATLTKRTLKAARAKHRVYQVSTCLSTLTVRVSHRLIIFGEDSPSSGGMHCDSLETFWTLRSPRAQK
jgi:hypothetical protein